MDLRQLRYFIRIVELGSFSRAARQLNVAQPALSRHVQSLEAEFGTQLLARTTRGVAVTEAGRAVVEHGMTLLNGAVALRDAVRNTSQRPAGEVTVGLPPSLSSQEVTSLLDDCRAAYPEIRLRLVEGVSIFLEEWLDRGSLDLAIVTSRASARHFETTELFREDFLLVGHLADKLAARHAVAPEDVAGLDLVMTRSFREIVSEQLGADIVHCRTEVDSFAVIRDMLDTSPTASLLPRGVTERAEWRDRFVVLPFERNPPVRSLVVAINSRRPKSAAVSAVHEAMMRRLRRGSSGASKAPLQPPRVRRQRP